MKIDLKFILMTIESIGLGIGIAIFAFVLLSPHTSATVVVFGTNYNYSEVVLPNNSYVHQGENISQGYFYDLGGVYGFSGKLAHWKNIDDIGYEAPDTIITLETIAHKFTYISPDEFPVGEWYQWDGQYCDEDKGYCSTGFGRGNNYAFTVVKKVPEWKTVDKSVTIVKNITITGEDGNERIVQVTVQETIQVRETVVDVLASNVTTLIVPTTIPPITTPPTPPPTLLLPNSDHTPVPTTLEVVTPKSAQNYVPCLVLIALAFVVMYRRE